MGDAVRTERLSKTFRSERRSTIALDGVSLSIPAGIVYGLIGRNGAGKTTFIRITSTQLMPTSGSVTVLGYDAVADPRPVRARIAVIPQESRPLYFLNVFELVYLYLKLRGMDAVESRRRTNAVLDELDLKSRSNTLVSRLSGGMRRRAMVAMVLASDAEVLYLDEPTTGLDPLARREVWSAIQRASREKRTVLLTTHYLDEAEALSARLALVESGHVVLEGTPGEIRSRIPRPYRVTVSGAVGRSELEPYGDVSEITGGHLVFAREREARELTMFALQKGIPVSMAPASLEDVFLQVVGRPISEGAEETEGEDAA
ncbi:MAG TPA: ABC transporter ATP-binding protein [Thermoplasmata archaeon]|nr:ABC transporter ATP-binding protein [Thermoplasmata archaeon]